jgi:hypothetical protein
MGAMWFMHVGEFSRLTDWPAILQHEKVVADTTCGDLDDESLDLADFSSLPEDMLELDDQHAAFLEESQYKKEEDEVERLVALIEVVSGLRSVHSCIMKPDRIEC